MDNVGFFAVPFLKECFHWQAASHTLFICECPSFSHDIPLMVGQLTNSAHNNLQHFAFDRRWQRHRVSRTFISFLPSHELSVDKTATSGSDATFLMKNLRTLCNLMVTTWEDVIPSSSVWFLWFWQDILGHHLHSPKDGLTRDEVFHHLVRYTLTLMNESVRLSQVPLFELDGVYWCFAQTTILFGCAENHFRSTQLQKVLASLMQFVKDIFPSVHTTKHNLC